MAFQDYFNGFNYNNNISLPISSYSDSLYSAVNNVPSLSDAISNYSSVNPTTSYYSPYGGTSSLMKYLLMIEQMKAQGSQDYDTSSSSSGSSSVQSTDSLYNKHSDILSNASLKLTSNQSSDKQNFEAHYEKYKEKYDDLAKKSHVPAKLIAAIHWRESGGDFNKKLRDGTSLGGQAFEKEALAVLKEHSGVLKKYGVDENCTDMAACASFAEAWNGLGYANKGKNSPYVYAGTSEYNAGKYVRDGVYDANAKDKQLGVVALLA
jgi:lysozyme family protein